MAKRNTPVKDEAEFIVVGTGTGGGTVARELARKGKSVIMLEKGREYNRLGSYLTYASMVWNKGLVTSKEGQISVLCHNDRWLFSSNRRLPYGSSEISKREVGY